MEVAQLRDVPFTFVSPKGVVVRQNLTWAGKNLRPRGVSAY